jgi:hypothetical protein
MCVLRVSGTDFDVDLFLKNSPLDPLLVVRRGEVQFPNSTMRQRANERSGMNVGVSEREFSDLKGQIEDAVGFLSENGEELKRLRDFPGVESISVDFPVEDRDVAIQCDAFPPSLLSLLGGLSIELMISRYPAHEEASTSTPVKR